MSFLYHPCPIRQVATGYQINPWKHSVASSVPPVPSKYLINRKKEKRGVALYVGQGGTPIPPRLCNRSIFPNLGDDLT
jgi:hypothetical protein